MEWILKAFMWIGSFTSILVAISAMVGFLMREKVKQHLARALALDVEDKRASLAREHARYSAELSREMEAYRVTLISQTEALKAAQQLKTALALKIGERRYTAIMEVQSAYGNLASAVLSVVGSRFEGSLGPQFFMEEWGKIFKRVQNANDVVGSVSVYLAPDLHVTLLSLQSTLLQTLSSRDSVEVPPVPYDSEQGTALLRMASHLDTLIQREIQSFELP